MTTLNRTSKIWASPASIRTKCRLLSSRILPVLEYTTECGNHVQADLKLIEGFLNTSVYTLTPSMEEGISETATGYPEEEVSPHHSAGIDQPESASILLLQAWLLEATGEAGVGNGEWRDRGNWLSFVSKDRRDVRLGLTGPSRELGKMVEARLEENSDVVVSEKERRETFDKGVSVEAEYAFCKEAVKEGSFKGGYRMNLNGADGGEHGQNLE